MRKKVGEIVISLFLLLQQLLLPMVIRLEQLLIGHPIFRFIQFLIRRKYELNDLHVLPCLRSAYLITPSPLTYDPT